MMATTLGRNMVRATLGYTLCVLYAIMPPSILSSFADLVSFLLYFFVAVFLRIHLSESNVSSLPSSVLLIVVLKKHYR